MARFWAFQVGHVRLASGWPVWCLWATRGCRSPTEKQPSTSSRRGAKRHPLCHPGARQSAWALRQCADTLGVKNGIALAQTSKMPITFTKLPDLLINLALVSEKQGKLNDSIGYLEAYIENCPNAPDLDKARQKIDELKIAIAIEAGKNPTRTVKTSLPPTPAIALMATGAGL